MGVKTHYQLMTNHQVYSDIGAYYQLMKQYVNLFGKPYPAKTRGWRKDIAAIYTKLTHDWGVNAIGQLTMVKTRNGHKFGIGKLKKNAKAKRAEKRAPLMFPDVVAVVRRLREEQFAAQQQQANIPQAAGQQIHFNAPVQAVNGDWFVNAFVREGGNR